MSGVAVTPDKEAEMYESFCVFKTEPKNTCLRCRLRAIFNNRAPRFSRWELERLWILFSGLSRVPGDRRVMHRDQHWGLEGSPRGPSLHPAVPDDRFQWVCSRSRCSLFQRARTQPTQRQGSLGSSIIAIGPISRRLHCHAESEEGNVTGQERIASPNGCTSFIVIFPLAGALTRTLSLVTAL